MTADILRQFMPYGAPDLQEAERPHLVRALALGSAIAISVFALAWSLSLIGVERQPEFRRVAIPTFDVGHVDILQPPPPIAPRVPTPTVAQPAKAAIPVPVPDQLAPPNQTLADQKQTSGIIGDGAATGAKIGPLAPLDGPVNHPGEVLFVDQLPNPVRIVQPVYPELARSAMVEGLVMVNALVGKDGRVVEARVDPRINVLMLNGAALDAARQWVFTPALMNDHPVSVWVNIPFRFKLH